MFGVLVLSLIGSCLGVWGLSAQERVSSDVYDVRNPALATSNSAVEDHAVWALDILNGRIVTNTEVALRLSPQMTESVTASQFIADVSFLRDQAPFEVRGFTLDQFGVFSSFLRAVDGQVIELTVVAAPDPTRIDGLLLRPADPQRGPFDPAEAVVHLVAGWGLLLVGATTWLLRHRSRPGQLFLLAGVLWLAQLLELSGNSLLYTLGLFAGPTAAAAAAVALVTLDTAKLQGQARLVLLLIGLALLATLSPLLAIDTSVAELPDQLLSVTHDRDLARALTAIGQSLTIVAVLALAGLLFARNRRRLDLGAQQRAALAGVGAVIAVGVGALALWGLTGDHHDLSQSPLVSIIALAIPVGLAVASLQESRYALGGVATMVADVGDSSTRSGLQASLAKALGDPTVQLAFWSSDQDQYVTSTGYPITVEESATRAVTLLGEGSKRLGAVIHDPALLAEPQRVQAASAAIGLAIENEQRKAVTAAVLRSSRARIAESAEQARRDVERDLHDGAQQRLIALQLSIKLEHQRAERVGDTIDPAFLHGISTELGDAIAELRELGRGLRPSALGHGLQAAVESLAERSPLPIVTDVCDQRADPGTEAAAYFVINESVANATRHSGADHIRVSVEVTPDDLVVVVADDGSGGAAAGVGAGLQSLEDRVLAMDGNFKIASPAGQGTVVTATLPRKEQP